MAILRSLTKAGKTKPQAKSFKELVSRIGQRTQLAPPGYADNSKLRTAFLWGRWTKYVDCSIHGPYPSSWAQANETGPRFCQKVYEESNHFRTSDPVDVCKNHLHYEVVRSFLEWSCEISGFTASVSLFTYARAWRMAVLQYTRSPVDSTIKMDMKNVREHVFYP
jgi:hypothetical protein